MIKTILHHFNASRQALDRTLQHSVPDIAKAAELCAHALRQGGKLLIAGNGGSAADALHFSGELLNRFERERPPLAAIALNADVATLTAIANDYDYTQVFSKQIEALGRPGDVFLAFSTSGQSKNILRAVHTAQALGLSVVAFTGEKGGALRSLLEHSRLCEQRPYGDIELIAYSHQTARIQEIHMIMVHCLCELIDSLLYPTDLHLHPAEQPIPATASLEAL